MIFDDLESPECRNDGRIRVLIADDHGVITQALRLYLEQAELDVVGTVATGRQAVEATLGLRPDVVLLDIAMPDMDGLAALSVIKYLCAETHVVMLSSYSKPGYMTRAVELGASGFFSKGAEPKEITEAIHELASGGCIPQRPHPLHEPAAPRIPGHVDIGWDAFAVDEVTDQEIRILKLIAQGHNNNSIVEKLCISRNTLKTHMRNIYEKLGVSDRTQAAIWAIRHGLVSLDEPLLTPQKKSPPDINGNNLTG